MKAAILAALVTGIAATTSKLLWQQHEAASVYTSAGLSRHIGAEPTFATATWLNQPYMIETFNCTDNGSYNWQFQFNGTPPRGDIPTYFTDMSRHAVGFPTATQVVDTVGAGAFFVPPSGCTVYGFDSRSATPTPVWTWSLQDCDASLLYGEYRNLMVSDDGTTAAFSAFIPDATNPQAAPKPALHVFNAQTGAVLFKADETVAGAAGGTVAASKNGAYVTWSTANGLAVFSPRGVVRDLMKGVEGPNEISDSGVYIASCTENAARLFEWDGTAYAENKTLAPPPSPISPTWFCTDVAMSSDGSGAEGSELVSFAWISEDVLTARVTTFSMVTGKLLTDWVSATNAKLQTNPTIRMDEQYTAVALWGDSDDQPTAVVLASGANTPIFTYTTPGSMFAVDVVVDKAASTPKQDVLYIAVAGKATPANVMGNGGDAFAWQVINPVV